MEAVRVVGTWSEERPLSWEGSALSSETSVAAMVLCQPGLACWAKSKPGTEHSLKLLLHPLETHGSRVQPIAYVGAGVLAQTVECRVDGAAPPTIAPALLVPEAQPQHLATLSQHPETSLHLLFFSKHAVTVKRNHIWRPKSLSGLPEPFRSAMAGGRAGRLAG